MRGSAGACASSSTDLRAIGARERDEIARTVPQGAAPRRRLQPRHLRPAERAAVHARRQRQPRAPAGRQRRHARADAARSRCKLAPLPAHKALGVVNFPTLLSRRWSARSTSSSSAPTAVELVDRTMIELARAQSGVPAGDRRGADRRARRRSCWSSSPATTTAPLRAPARRAGRADGRPRPARQRRRDDRRRRRRRRCGKCARPASTS